MNSNLFAHNGIDHNTIGETILHAVQDVKGLIVLLIVFVILAGVAIYSLSSESRDQEL